MKNIIKKELLQKGKCLIVLVAMMLVVAGCGSSEDVLEEKNIIGDVFTTIQYNMGRYDMVKVDFDVLKEYDPEGFNKYIKKDDKELDM